MNCAYKPCPTGIQLAGWCNQISNNALLKYLLWSKCASWGVQSKCFYSSCSSRKDALALFRHFQDSYCCLNSDVTRHVTEYCNVIGPHCTVQRDTVCICSSPDPSPFYGSESSSRGYPAHTLPTHIFLVPPLDLLLATSAHSGILETIDWPPTVFLVLELLQTWWNKETDLKHTAVE